MKEIKNMKDMMNMPMNAKESKGKGKINSINIRKAENGWAYSVNTDKMEHEEYVYEEIDDLMEAIKDDLKSPHIRNILTAKKAGMILHDKEVKGNPLTKKQRGFFGAIASGKSKKMKDLMA